MKGAEHNSTQELVLGLLHWPSHTEALLAKAALSYKDATSSDWKLIIDQWIVEGRDEQRGAIFTTDPEKFKQRGKKEERQNDSPRSGERHSKHLGN